MSQNEYIAPEILWTKELKWPNIYSNIRLNSLTTTGNKLDPNESIIHVSQTYCDVKLENNNVNMKFIYNEAAKKSHKFLFEILKKCPFMETATGEFPNLNVVHLREGEAIYAHENYSKDQKIQFVRQIFTALLLLKKRGVRILKHIDREMLVVDRHQQLKLKGFACDLIDEGDYKFFNKILAGLIYHIDPQARDPLLIDLMKSIVNNSSDENPLSEKLLAHPYFRQNNHNRLPTLVSVFEGDCLFVCLSGTTVLRLGNVKANPEGVDLFDNQLKVVDNNTFKRDTSHLSVTSTEVVGSKCVVIHQRHLREPKMVVPSVVRLISQADLGRTVVQLGFDTTAFQTLKDDSTNEVLVRFKHTSSTQPFIHTQLQIPMLSDFTAIGNDEDGVLVRLKHSVGKGNFINQAGNFTPPQMLRFYKTIVSVAILIQQKEYNLHLQRAIRLEDIHIDLYRNLTVSLVNASSEYNLNLEVAAIVETLQAMNYMVPGVSLSYFDEYLQHLKRAECISSDCMKHPFFTQFGRNQFPELHITVQGENLVVTSLMDKNLKLYSYSLQNFATTEVASSLVVSETNKSIFMVTTTSEIEDFEQFKDIRLGTEHINGMYVSYFDWEPQNFVDRGQNVRTFHFPVLAETFDPGLTTQFDVKMAKFAEDVQSFMSHFPMTKFGLNADEASSLHLIPSTSANPPDLYNFKVFVFVCNEMSKYGLFLREPVNTEDLFLDTNEVIVVTALRFTVNDYYHEKCVRESLEKVGRLLSIPLRDITSITDQVRSFGVTPDILNHAFFYKDCGEVQQHLDFCASLGYTPLVVVHNDFVYIYKDSNVIISEYRDHSHNLPVYLNLTNGSTYCISIVPKTLDVEGNEGGVLCTEETHLFKILYVGSFNHLY